MKSTILKITIVSILLTNCKKFVDPGQPGTHLTGQAIFSTDATAHAAQLAIYSSMETDALAYNLLMATGLSADELSNYSTTTASVDVATNNLVADNPFVLSLWTNLYKYIYQANSVLEGISNSNTLSTATREQLEGEAKFIRAFCHFYLTLLYGEVPLVTTTDYRITSSLHRNPVAEVYNAIQSDLQDAINLLSSNYIGATGTTTTERVRPNKSAAQALLIRFHLFLGHWPEAETLSSALLNQTSQYSLTNDLNRTFLKNSTETIWQWMAVVPRYNSSVGANTVLLSTPSVFALDTSFVKSFRPGDKRKTAWINSITVAGNTYFYPYKYKVGQNASTVTEYTMALRLGEIYLIRAECYAQQGNLSAALDDLNTIRVRAGLSSLPALNQPDLIDSIHAERRYELFAEFGDRWFDLHRTGRADQVLGFFKGANWSPTDKLYPIPQQERDRNPNLSQNNGY